MAFAVSAITGSLGLPAALLFPQQARRFIPVHLWHLAIHKHKIKARLIDRRERLATVVGEADLELQFPEHYSRNVLVDLVVLD